MIMHLGFWSQGLVSSLTAQLHVSPSIPLSLNLRFVHLVLTNKWYSNKHGVLSRNAVYLGNNPRFLTKIMSMNQQNQDASSITAMLLENGGQWINYTAAYLRRPLIRVIVTILSNLWDVYFICLYWLNNRGISQLLFPTESNLNFDRPTLVHNG